ncbi:MAG: glycosyltransferase family 9 protein [Desulfomonile tiedjei]|uniref:Glycosyltransferase family 9 protein n=1 Tax=Desulfomonile tiedjei TaxID=2358 RepID=A0A9D6Z243_9BACT|nr:glycosyltransferase family 9 protein [Desulfomonile tiedjei]
MPRTSVSAILKCYSPDGAQGWALNGVANISEQSVLVIRTGALGDTILTLPVLASIQAAHPGVTVTFLGNRAYRDLIPEGIGFRPVDGIEWSWLFGPHAAGAPESAKAFTKAYVILNKADDVIRNLVRTGTRSVASSSSAPGQVKHIVEHIHESLGLPTAAKRPVFRRIGGQSILRPIIWLHPGSGGLKKCVPLAGISRIALELQSKTGFHLVITAGEEDEFLKRSPEWGNLLSAAGSTLLENRPLSEIMKVLRHAAVFIGNDSGISHMAANMGVKSVVFFVASDPAQWSPWVPERDMRIIDLRNQDVVETGWISAGLAAALDLLSERSMD